MVAWVGGAVIVYCTSAVVWRWEWSAVVAVR